MDLITRLKNIFNHPGEGGRSKFASKLLILLVVGIGLITFNSLFKSGEDRAAPTEGETALPRAGEMIQEARARELALMLEQIRGVSNVYVLVTLEDSGQKEPAYDQDQTGRQTVEQDGGGGTRAITEDITRRTHVILRDAQGREIPLVVREYQPTYRGVLVVAEGVADPLLKAQVVEAVRVVLDLPYHRITVLPRGN